MQELKIEVFKYLPLAIIICITERAAGRSFDQTQMIELAFTGKHPLTYFSQPITMAKYTVKQRSQMNKRGYLFVIPVCFSFLHRLLNDDFGNTTNDL